MQGSCSPQNVSDLCARGRAQQGGDDHPHQGQPGCELLDSAMEELVGQHTHQGGHQHHLEGAQSQALQRSSRGTSAAGRGRVLWDGVSYEHEQAWSIRGAAGVADIEAAFQ